MTATLKVIAEAAGVSIPVVSQVLNSKGQRFRHETRQRVREAARRLGYRPNASARAMATGRLGCAALVLSTQGYRSTLPAELLRGIDAELARHNIHLTIARLPDEKLTSEGYVPKILREWLADGLLINYTSDIPRKMLALIRGHDIPSVWINCKLPHDCVHPDDRGAGRLAGEHLLALGHRRIAYMCSWRPEDFSGAHYSVRDRDAGLRDALRKAGTAPLSAPGCDADEVRRLELIRDWLADPRSRPTGVLCYGDRDATLLAAAAMQLGLRIPRDISILLCADEPFDRMGFNFTSLIVPAACVGAEAVCMMRRKIENPSKMLPRRAIPFELHQGNTSAPPTMHDGRTKTA